MMKKSLWIYGAVAAFSLSAVTVIARTHSSPATVDGEGAPAMEMSGMRRMGQCAGPGVCPPGARAGMAGTCGREMMCNRGGCGEDECKAGRGMGLERLQALNLTSDQWARVRRIREDFQKQIIPKQSEIRVAQIDLQQFLQATQPNMNQVNGKITAIGNLRTQIQTLRTQETMQIRGVLTAEQLTKFLDPTWTPPCAGPGMQGAGPGVGRRPMMND